MWDLGKLKALAAEEARERDTSREVELAMTDFARMRGLTYLPYDRAEARERLHRQLPKVLPELEALPRGVVTMRDDLVSYADGVREQLGLAQGRAGKVADDAQRGAPLEVDAKVAALAEEKASDEAQDEAATGKGKFPGVWDVPPEERPGSRDRGRGR
ncbi:hypothetical protein [Hyphomicrobium sp. CS1BSMeth3]|uniref:hypothetical protein n=1 Tax=Hyphomicrobium sp. CS1BSMeth3 TaxID=1892844 RepID=UPI00093008C8|nr:hypothetical protein [Hyphomicrobium sp. CS1BSMeth3]